ncbi:hypothetical protein [Nocardioides marmoribigeumensis]|uniref:Uncharacterized protein n=1 Tax=Nocardioides marmoribigeumensis TaxID=433649 RepID=A0ABU2BTF6_9ACTN|nr:hypothetical protein [Nocardioides marmoribigeumensis]MDR7360634.1 hypothetical protein [Nocardioides marmoribigeumensis]
MGVAGAAVATAAGDPAASTSARSTLTGKSMYARTTLTSTSGKKIVFSVSGYSYSDGTTVSLSMANGTESHSWSYKARAADLTMDSTGKGTLTLTSTQTGDRGRVKLSFRPTDPAKTTSCGGQVSSKTRKVAVSGIAFAKSATKAWGNVGKASSSITFGTGSVSWSYDNPNPCPSPKPPCASSLSWSVTRSSATSYQGISGYRTGTKASAYAYRNVKLSSPAGAYRSDSRSLSSVTLPTFKGTAASATLVAKAGGGSATLTGKNGYSYTNPCGTSGTLKSTSWSQATAKNGSPALKIPTQIYPAFVAANTDSAYFSRTVVS